MVKQGMKQNKILVLHDAIVALCIYVFPFQRKSWLQDLNTFQMLSEKNHNLSNDKKDIQSKHQGKGSVDIYSGSLKFDH